MKLRELALSVLNFFVGIAVTFLGLRFILKLFGANAGNAFVSWVYDMSQELLEPFRGIFPTRAVENDFVIEFSTLFAILIYMIAGLLLVALVEAVTRPAVSSSKKVKR